MSLDRYRVIFGSKHECSPAANKAGLELVAEIERLRKIEEAARRVLDDGVEVEDGLLMNSPNNVWALRAALAFSTGEQYEKGRVPASSHKSSPE